MTYLLHKDNSQDSAESFTQSWRRYREYLASVSEKLPASAREFALAEWHYDFRDHRAPHDAWVESINIIETGTGERQEKRETQIKIRLFCAYHDGYIGIEYINVMRYSIGSEKRNHGDWGYDEIRLSDQGHVIHEIECGDVMWVIECQDIHYAWLPKS